MKGVIAICLKEVIVSKFGTQKWNDIMMASGLNPNMALLASVDLDDAVVMNVVKNSCRILNLSLQQIADYFGDHWMNSYAPKMYKPYYGTNTTAKDFIIRLSEIQTKVTNNIQNANPPRFKYLLKNENTLILTYFSNRGMIELVVGLAKGVGRYFQQKLLVRKISHSQVEIIFQ
jgi:hypothetical protein